MHRHSPLPALAAILMTAAAFVPTVANAHAKLLNATPAAGTAVSKPTAISLDFSEELDSKLSGIELVMSAMPGMADHKPMPIKGFTATVNGRTLAARLPRALPGGTYQLTWHAAGADQHPVKGSYEFTVR